MLNAQFKFVWHGGRVERAIRLQLERNLERAGRHLQASVRKLISRPGQRTARMAGGRMRPFVQGEVPKSATRIPTPAGRSGAVPTFQVTPRQFTRLLSAKPSGAKPRGRVRLLTRSRPGEPPRRQLGNLWRSIFYRVNRRALQVTVGAKAPYAMYLELGTSRMAPRPFLRRTLAEQAGAVGRIMATKVPG